MTEIPTFRAVSLNIWGIYLVSKSVQTRVKHITAALKTCDYDLVALQEVWCKGDYRYMRRELRERFPHTYYFHNGWMGTGCCFFSAHPIEDVFQHQFSVNGYPHRVDHADWYAGKSVCLAVLNYHGLRVHVYTTHLHANYDVNGHPDQYEAHRLVQLIETAQFVSYTSHAADLAILLGDLNTEEREVGYRVLRARAELLDAFKEADALPGPAELRGITCHSPANVYGQPNDDIRNTFPHGIRIDYILYKAKSGVDVKCLEYKSCMGRVPSCDEELNYSDHEGIFAAFKISREATATSKTKAKHVEASSLDDLKMAHQIVLQKYNQMALTYVKVALLLFACFVLFFSLNTALVDFELLLLVQVKNFVAMALASALFAYLVFFMPCERKSLYSMTCILQEFIRNMKKLD